MGVNHPFGAPTTATLTATGSQAITLDDALTLIDGTTTIATGARTLVLTIPSSVLIGAQIFLKVKTTGIETTVFSTGFTCPTITGVVGKTFCAAFRYDGVTFKPTAAPYQID